MNKHGPLLENPPRSMGPRSIATTKLAVLTRRLQLLQACRSLLLSLPCISSPCSASGSFALAGGAGARAFRSRRMLVLVNDRVLPYPLSR